MTTPTKQIVTSLVAATFLTLPGCGPGDVTGLSSGGPSWTVASEDPIPGIHEGTARVMTFKFRSSNSVTVVVWCDRSGGSGSHGSSRRNAASVEGFFRLPDEDQVEFQCETDDGSVSELTIDGRTYDSSKGLLFLISTQSKGIQVKQLDADVRDFPAEAVAIKDYALANPDISAFFTEAKNDNPGSPK